MTVIHNERGERKFIWQCEIQLNKFSMLSKPKMENGMYYIFCKRILNHICFQYNINWIFNGHWTPNETSIKLC